MDDLLNALAEKIYSTGNGYNIFYEDELWDTFLLDEQKNRQTLDEVLKQLAKGGFIDIKYSKGEVFCIATLKRYEQNREIAPDKPPKESAPNFKKVCIYASTSAFLGGVLSGAICFMLAALT